jgi:hypothetical protein
MKRGSKTENIVLLLVILLAIIAPAIVRCKNAVADSTATTGNANSSTTTIESASFVIGMNQYFINNQTPGISMDVAPYIDPNSGRTLVPIRYLADALGATTNWDGDTKTVTVSTAVYNIGLTIGNPTLTVDGLAQAMDAAPAISNGRTYLPARWVAQALGYLVQWDATNKIVIIYSASNIGVPAYNNVIEQAQLNVAKPEQVQKLESALGITMTGGDPGWSYDPTLNPDGSTNIAWQKQNMNNSFVVAGFTPGDSKTSSEIDVAIESVSQDSSKISVDLSPLQKVLEAFFPGQHDFIQQVMAFTQQDASHAQANYGWNPIPGQTMTNNGLEVGVGQGNGRTYASLEILGS